MCVCGGGGGSSGVGGWVGGWAGVGRGVGCAHRGVAPARLLPPGAPASDPTPATVHTHTHRHQTTPRTPPPMQREMDGVLRRMLAADVPAPAETGGGAQGGKKKGGGEGKKGGKAGGGAPLAITAAGLERLPRWRKVEPLAKSYLGNTLHLLGGCRGWVGGWVGVTGRGGVARAGLHTRACACIAPTHPCMHACASKGLQSNPRRRLR